MRIKIIIIIIIINVFMNYMEGKAMIIMNIHMD